MTFPRAFYLLVNGKPHGPFPVEKLRQQMASGVLRPGTQVSNDGFTWRPVESVMAELGAVTPPPFRPAAVPPPPTVPSWPSISGAQGYGSSPPAGSGSFLQHLPPPPPPPQTGSNHAALLAVGLLCLVLMVVLTCLIAFRQNPGVAEPDEPERREEAGAPVNPGKQAQDVPFAGVPVLEPLPKPKPPDRLTAQMLVAKCAPSVAMIEFENTRGSGFLVDSDLLATNAHVVGNRNNAVVRVSFPSAEGENKGPLNGRVVFIDTDRDLALVRVESKLPFLKLGNSDQLNKGEDIVVIGSPGLGPNNVLVNAISKGVYSTTVDLKGAGSFLHMSLAINPGNSGGPAFNDRGEVVGMVTAKGVKVEGVALCVPANDLKSAIQDLK